MKEVIDRKSGAILFKKESTETRIEQLEKEMKEIKELLYQLTTNGAMKD